MAKPNSLESSSTTLNKKESKTSINSNITTVSTNKHEMNNLLTKAKIYVTSAPDIPKKIYYRNNSELKDLDTSSSNITSMDSNSFENNSVESVNESNENNMPSLQEATTISSEFDKSQISTSVSVLDNETVIKIDKRSVRQPDEFSGNYTMISTMPSLCEGVLCDRINNIIRKVEDFMFHIESNKASQFDISTLQNIEKELGSIVDEFKEGDLGKDNDIHTIQTALKNLIEV